MPSLGCNRPWRKYLLSAVAAVLLVALVGAADGAVKEPVYRPDTCIFGDKHKTKPSPEDDSFKTCHPWKEGACCSAEFTQQLDAEVVTNIDGFHWNRCGNFTPACQRFFVEIECFYRCSPNTAHWEGLFPSSLNHLPICSDYCDKWYEACAPDMTCAANWITDWNYTNGNNYCKPEAQCSRFDQMYNDSRALCNTLWGQSFVYSDDASTSPTRRCLVPWFSEDSDVNPNEAVVRRIFNVPNAAAGAFGFRHLFLVTGALVSVLSALI